MASYAYFFGVNDEHTDVAFKSSRALSLTFFFLQSLDFDTRYIEGNCAEEIESQIDAIKSRLKPGDTFLLYFTGPGEIADGQLRLLPWIKTDGDNSSVVSVRSLRALTERPQWNGVQRVFMFDFSTKHGQAPQLKGGGEHSAGYLLWE